MAAQRKMLCVYLPLALTSMRVSSEYHSWSPGLRFSTGFTIYNKSLGFRILTVKLEKVE